MLVEFNDADVDRIGIEGVPLVAIDSYSGNPRTIGVRSDDYEGGRLAATHLLGAGHRRLLFAGPARGATGVVAQRWAGFCDALAANGVASSDVVVEEVPTALADGRDLGLRLTRDHPDVTAVFATADVLAIGVTAGGHESGRRVPDDVSVIGFDNLDISGYSSPRLTTIGQDMTRKVAEAARIILAEIEGDLSPSAPVSLPVELVERGSVRVIASR